MNLLAAASVTNEQRLVSVLLELIVIVAVARLFGMLFRRLGQPVVVGEIAAGVVLGPSVFGKLETWAGLADHRFSHAIFNPASGEVFTVISQLGLILLLFLVGLEFEFKHLKTSHRAALAISGAGVVLPFLLGWYLAHLIHPWLEGVERSPGVVGPVDVHGFSLFMGTAMAITALPVLGRMLMELNLTRTRIGTVAITAAAMDDATGWILLAAVSAMVQTEYHVGGTLRMIGLTVGFALLMFVAARPVLHRWIAWSLKRGGGDLGVNALAMLLVIILLCAIATSLIGIFAIFGAFTLGATLSGQPAFREAVTRQLRNFVTVFFLPVFFTYTGLRTDIGTLTSPWLWGIALAVTGAAVAGKFGGCALAARLSGIGWRESACVGVMMNTRGLMELIVINIGYDLNIIPRSIFCMLVMMALVTTVMTTPLLRRLKRGTELDDPMEASALGRRHGAHAVAILIGGLIRRPSIQAGARAAILPLSFSGKVHAPDLRRSTLWNSPPAAAGRPPAAGGSDVPADTCAGPGTLRGAAPVGDDAVAGGAV